MVGLGVRGRTRRILVMWPAMSRVAPDGAMRAKNNEPGKHGCARGICCHVSLATSLFCGRQVQCCVRQLSPFSHARARRGAGVLCSIFLQALWFPVCCLVTDFDLELTVFVLCCVEFAAVSRHPFQNSAKGEWCHDSTRATQDLGGSGVPSVLACCWWLCRTLLSCSCEFDDGCENLAGQVGDRHDLTAFFAMNVDSGTQRLLGCVGGASVHMILQLPHSAANCL